MADRGLGHTCRLSGRIDVQRSACDSSPSLHLRSNGVRFTCAVLPEVDEALESGRRCHMGLQPPPQHGSFVHCCVFCASRVSDLSSRDKCNNSLRCLISRPRNFVG